MKHRKTFAAIAMTMLILVAAVIGIRIAVSLADKGAGDPSKMMERLETPLGESFFRVRAGVANAYLIRASGGWLLVDTGYPKDYGKFKTALSASGIDMKSVKWLFLTHAHDDHAGFAADLARDSGCSLILPKDSLGELGAGQMVWKGKAVNLRIAFVTSVYGFVKRRDMRFPPVSPRRDDIILNAEADLTGKRIGIEGSFVPTPGHSPDSWSLLMSDGRVFCGDAAMNFLNVLGAGYRPIFITDEGQTYASLRRLISLGATRFLSGHGPDFELGRVEGMLARFDKGRGGN